MAHKQEWNGKTAVANCPTCGDAKVIVSMGYDTPAREAKEVGDWVLRGLKVEILDGPWTGRPPCKCNRKPKEAVAEQARLL